MRRNSLCIAIALALGVTMTPQRADAGKIKVVTTLPVYAWIAGYIGGDRVETTSLAKGYQDPHFIQPKLSLSEKLASADLFVDSGLDLEMWVPALQDSAGNKKIQSGGVGYVSASKGITLLQKVPVADRKEGDLHVFGNPHFYVSPVHQRQIARNICAGLKKVDPAGASHYEKRKKKFIREIDERMYGVELVTLIGGEKLSKLAIKGKLVPFLEKTDYEGYPLVDRLGGWMKLALPLRGKRVVAFHKNWAYFTAVFGFEIVGYIEPKPGIPPTTKHIEKVVDVVKKNDVDVLLAATYYDTAKVKAVAKKTGVSPVIVGVDVGGQKGLGNGFKVTQNLLEKLVAAVGD